MYNFMEVDDYTTLQVGVAQKILGEPGGSSPPR